MTKSNMDQHQNIASVCRGGMGKSMAHKEHMARFLSNVLFPWLYTTVGSTP